MEFSDLPADTAEARLPSGGKQAHFQITKALGETLGAGMKTALQFRAAVLGAVAARVAAE
jgi:hypothetical protein